jgi:hypothetical protein
VRVSAGGVPVAGTGIGSAFGVGLAIAVILEAASGVPETMRPVTELPDVERVYLGRTSERYVCHGCDRWTEMDRLADERGFERIENERGAVGYATIQPGALDPPSQPTLYECPSCHHKHVGRPSLKTPTYPLADASLTGGNGTTLGPRIGPETPKAPRLRGVHEWAVLGSNQ